MSSGFGDQSSMAAALRRLHSSGEAVLAAGLQSRTCNSGCRVCYFKPFTRASTGRGRDPGAKYCFAAGDVCGDPALCMEVSWSKVRHRSSHLNDALVFGIRPTCKISQTEAIGSTLFVSDSLILLKSILT